MVYVDPEADSGQGEVMFTSVNPFDVFVDPYSTDPLFSDATFILIKKDLKRKFLMDQLPDYAKKIENAPCNDEHTESYSDKSLGDGTMINRANVQELLWAPMKSGLNNFIDYYELYEKVPKRHVRVTFRLMDDKEAAAIAAQLVEQKFMALVEDVKLEVADRTIALQDEMQKGAMSEARYTFEAQRIQREAERKLVAEKDRLVQEASVATSTTKTAVMTLEDYEAFKSNKATKDKIIEAEEFWKPVIHLTVSIGDETLLFETDLPISDYPLVPIPFIHPGTPYCISIVSMIKGRQEELTKSHQLMIYNASLGSSLRWMYRVGSIDLKTWEQRVTIPGGLLPVLSGEPPTPVMPAPLSESFREITMMASRDIDDLFGVMSTPSMAREGGTQSPYRGLLALDEFSTRRSKAWVTSAIDPALTQIAKVWQEYAVITYTTNRVFRIVQPNGQSTTVEINIPIYNDKSAEIGRWNDLSTLKYDIRFESGGTMPVNRFARQQEYRELFTAGVIDDIALIAELDIPGKEALLARKSTYVQLNQQIAAMDADIKKLKGENETLSREIVQAGIQRKVLTASVEIDKSINANKAAQDGATAQFKAGLQATQAQVNTEAKDTIRQHQANLDQIERDREAEAQKPAPKKP
jgi:hypothetical protein